MTSAQLTAAVLGAIPVLATTIGILWRALHRANKELAAAQRSHAEQINAIHEAHAEAVAELHREHNATTAQVFTVLEPLSELLASLRRRTPR